MSLPAWDECGYISGAHGVNGWCKIQAEQHILDKLTKGNWLFILIQDKPVPFFIEQGEGLGILQLQGMNSPEDVSFLRGKSIALPKELTIGNENDRLSSFEFLHWSLYDSRSEKLIGEITTATNQTGQWLLNVQYKEVEIIIPYHEDFLSHIDSENRCLYLNLPDGLIDDSKMSSVH